MGRANADIAFLAIPDLQKDGSAGAIRVLHDVLKEACAPYQGRVSVFSALAGAILVFPHRRSSPQDKLPHKWIVDDVYPKCKRAKIAVRAGISTGSLWRVQDVDGSDTCIGVHVNYAARLATSDHNESCAVAAPYIIRYDTNDFTDNWTDVTSRIQGKEHDRDYNEMEKRLYPDTWGHRSTPDGGMDARKISSAVCIGKSRSLGKAPLPA